VDGEGFVPGAEQPSEQVITNFSGLYASTASVEVYDPPETLSVVIRLHP
jgi:hypothetical protein